MTDEEKKNSRVQIYEEKALEGAAAEVVQRYGSALKQHLVAFSGEDNETGKKLTKSLKSISEYKLNPDYKDQNIKQQAGYSAEVKTTANRNAENIIKNKSSRTSRTDDLGRVNDQLYDLVEIDQNGNIISGSASQMKFVGNSPKATLDLLSSKKYKKYLDADTILDIADDDYDALIGKNGSQGIIDSKIQDLEKQLKKAEENGKSDLVASKKEKIEKLKKIKKNVRKSGMTRDEAIDARLRPELSTVKDVTRIAHKAGKEQAKYGAIISGATSIVRNVVQVVKGEKDAEEAAITVAKDTGKGVALSYTTAFSGSIIKGTLQNSKSGYLRGLSKTNLAAGLVTTTMNVGRTLGSYIKGDITGAECVETLGEQGVGEIGSAMFAAIGHASVKGAESVILSTIASAAGAVLGYAAAAAVYQELATSLKEYEFAKEERIRIEQECEKAVELIQQYRMEMTELAQQYLKKNIQTFDEGFKAIDKAIIENDTNGFIRGNAAIQEVLGKEIQYHTQEEFDILMLSDEPFKL